MRPPVASRHFEKTRREATAYCNLRRGPTGFFQTVACAQRLPTPTAHISSEVLARPPSAALSLMRA
jgi:hypothetical protein